MKRRLIIALVLIVAVVLGYVFFFSHGSYRMALEAYKRDMHAKGEKLTIAELAPPRAPTISQGAALFMAVPNLGYWPTNLPSRMITVAPGRAMIGFSNITSDQLRGYETNVQTMTALRTALKTEFLDFNLDYSMGAALSLP